ncbi:MAG: hypothetical protein P4L45_09925 [Ignavibacteriaceae bacterium]|nr:hypothetical protein [Ignavibacteriaceae bacterium]
MIKPQRTIIIGASVLLLILTVSFILFISKDDPRFTKNFEIGEQDAAADIARGKFTYRIQGLPKEGVDDNWAAMLYNNNNILVDFMGCEIGDDGEYWFGYGMKTRDEIRNRFGKNFIDSTIALNIEREKKGEKCKFKRHPNFDDDDICKLIGSSDLTLPDSLGGLSIYGYFDANITLTSKGNITNVSPFDIFVYSNPYSNKSQWDCNSDNILVNNYHNKVIEWIKTKIKSMKCTINARHPLWYLRKTNRTIMGFSINSQEVRISIKEDTIHVPQGVIPAKSEVSAKVYGWIDKYGKIKTYKISSIEIRRTNNTEKYIEPYKSYTDENGGDISVKPSGDASLLTKYGKYIRQRIYNSSYTVDPNLEYFKHYDVTKQKMDFEFK